MARNLLPVPQALVMEGNMTTNWLEFKRSWLNYERATKLYDEVEEVRVATLLTIIGSQANDVYEGIKFEKGKEKKMDEIIKAFDNYFMGKTNKIYRKIYFQYKKPKGR